MDDKPKAPRPIGASPRGDQRSIDVMRARMKGRPLPDEPIQPAAPAPPTQQQITETSVEPVAAPIQHPSEAVEPASQSMPLHERKWLRITAIAAISLLLIVALSFGTYLLFHKTPVIPASVKSQVSFTIFYPSAAKGYKVDSKNVTYNSKNKLLNIIAYAPNGNKLTFNEQPTPDRFNDFPTAYDSLIKALQGYLTFDSASGKVSLTKPKELGGSQSATMNSKGTLMFVRPATNMSDDEWKQLFNSLIVAQ